MLATQKCACVRAMGVPTFSPHYRRSRGGDGYEYRTVAARFDLRVRFSQGCSTTQYLCVLRLRFRDLSDRCRQFRLRVFPSPFIAAAYFWVRSPEAFGATLARHGAEMHADIGKFSDTQPLPSRAELV